MKFRQNDGQAAGRVGRTGGQPEAATGAILLNLKKNEHRFIGQQALARLGPPRLKS